MIWFLRWGEVIKTLLILVNDRASERKVEVTVKAAS